MSNYNNSRNSNWNNNQNSQRAQTKKSGAVYTKIGATNKAGQKNNSKYVGGTIVNAWNVSKSRGMITATVSPYHKTKQGKTKNGRVYQTMIAVINYRNSGVEKIIPVTMDAETRVISIPEIGMCISPNGKGQTSSGKVVTGYFGTFNRK